MRLLKLLQLFPLGLLAQHLLLELKESRKTKEDQKQKQRFFYLIQPICIISENFCNHIRWNFSWASLQISKNLSMNSFLVMLLNRLFSLLKVKNFFFSIVSAVVVFVCKKKAFSFSTIVFGRCNQLFVQPRMVNLH